MLMDAGGVHGETSVVTISVRQQMSRIAWQ
jgi:hypothetical protein